MKSLETLLKVAQRRLDDLGAEIFRHGQRLDGLRLKEATMLAREQVEIQAAATDLALMPLMPAYRQRIAHQVGLVRAEIVEAEATLEIVREQLKAAFQEKSKFEELLERERKRAEAARLALEQAALDEVAINRVGRD